ncbi:MAG: cystathionine beta-lyase family protein involved in aluminum resistance [Myxococcota bacterium]|jgi:cystathionine beta-lyase family protein involved in aluminum resistance
MDRVVIFLKNALFAEDKKSGHVPAHTMILEGQVTEKTSGGFIVAVTGYRAGDNKALEGKPCRLFLPNAKIDHMLLLED